MQVQLFEDYTVHLFILIVFYLHADLYKCYIQKYIFIRILEPDLVSDLNNLHVHIFILEIYEK